ncbi:MAG: LPS export ABC transporter periplasmic protein LptC [Pseudomonadales bacterium]|nr:LPS export ABC transporter periplasmic protein LptC [Pseudomonadales bacterium]
MLRRNRFLIIIASTAVMLFSYLIGEITFDPFDPFDRKWLREVKRGPQYIMQGTTTIQYDELGTERFRMTAAQLSQASGSDSTEILKPKIVLQKSTGQSVQQSWIIQADKGTIHSSPQASQEQLSLQQNVSISNLSSDAVLSTERFSLSTSQLDIFPQQKHAHSTEQVTLRTKGVDTQAVGLDLDFDRGVVKLKSNIQTSIRPRKPSTVPTHSTLGP